MTQVRKRRPPATPRLAAACAGPLDDLLDPALFKALGDPTRAALFTCIAKCARGCTVGEVAECCSVDLSVVSRHLALLARAGAITPRKEGRTVFYAVRYAELSRTFRALASALAQCSPASNPRKGTCHGACC
jgi:DNA-binding transcriptional ArsR family regulator